jgi:prenylcysteine oxidase/farnesylcysteine lyase
VYVTIGIIGGGIGGTGSAYFLKQLLHEEDEISVDIFEPRHIGGRLRVINVGGREYEAGGSIIHPRNKYMQRFVKELGTCIIIIIIIINSSLFKEVITCGEI